MLLEQEARYECQSINFRINYRNANSHPLPNHISPLAAAFDQKKEAGSTDNRVASSKRSKELECNGDVSAPAEDDDEEGSKLVVHMGTLPCVHMGSSCWTFWQDRVSCSTRDS